MRNESNRTLPVLALVRKETITNEQFLTQFLKLIKCVANSVLLNFVFFFFEKKKIFERLIRSL